jgi:hypothetical protein
MRPYQTTIDPTSQTRLTLAARNHSVPLGQAHSRSAHSPLSCSLSCISCLSWFPSVPSASRAQSNPVKPRPSSPSFNPLTCISRLSWSHSVRSAQSRSVKPRQATSIVSSSNPFRVFRIFRGFPPSPPLSRGQSNPVKPRPSSPHQSFFVYLVSFVVCLGPALPVALSQTQSSHVHRLLIKPFSCLSHLS